MTIQEAARPVFDKQDQLDKIVSGLLPGEVVLAVYDGIGTGTGFIGLTDKRVIVQDNSFVGKQVAVTSVPYSRVSSVSVVSNKSMMGSFFSTSMIAIHAAGQTYQVQFRGDEKAHHAHQVILHYITQ